MAASGPSVTVIPANAGIHEHGMRVQSAVSDTPKPLFMDPDFRRGADSGFARFAAIDWSGAKGRKHKGIKIAMADSGRVAPVLVRPDHVWSRTEVLDWLLAAADKAPTLFGFDFSFAPPIAERGEYLPGEDAPADAMSFWAYVDRLSDDEDLGAASFLESSAPPAFLFRRRRRGEAGFPPSPRLRTGVQRHGRRQGLDCL